MNRTSFSQSANPDPGPPVEPGWQQQLRDAVRRVDVLERLLKLPASSLEARLPAGSDFPLLVPISFVQRMRKGDPDDPLLRQVLPDVAEDAPTDGFGADPLREQGLAQHGVISKYPGRSLMIATGACPVHCRYCFRREFPYSSQTAARDQWLPAIGTIRATPGVREVILSGGDPLTLNNRQLRRLIAAIEDIPQVATLRIHTRFPVVLPARIEPGLIRLLTETRLNIVIVVHSNHPNEIDDAVTKAAGALKACTGLLLNQSVLLRGINDSAEILIELSERLAGAGIAPYYLHLLDRVAGAAHFEVGSDRALELIASMRRHAPGYLVPTLVRDIPGELSKTVIGR